jgi:outer membrane protein TolC
VVDYQQLASQIFGTQQGSGLQRYIAQVLSSNAYLRSIAATARADGHRLTSAEAETLPRADLDLSGSRNKDAITQEITNTASLGVDVSWALDLWGRLSDNTAAAKYLADKAGYELHQARRGLIAQAARAWVDYWGYVRTEENLAKLDTAYSHLRSHYEEAYQAGLAAYEFFVDAKRNQRRSHTRLQEIQLETLKTLRYMNTLRGQQPANELVINDAKVPFKLLAFTGDIPATALAERPDLQAAFAEVLAFRSSARAAHKALLPQITLTGSALKSGSSLEKAFSGDLVWQLIGGLTQPLFRGGQLKAIAQQKSAEAEASWWHYQNTVLQALLEVENAIASDKLLALQLRQKQTTLVGLEQKTHSTELRLSDGDLPFSDYLQIKIERIEAQLELSEIQVRYIKNRLDLAMALGLPMETLWGNDNEQS